MKSTRTAAIAAVFLVALGFAPPPSYAAAAAAEPSDCTPPPGLQPARLAKVLDGDTVTLDDGRHVRLIGVNTPERAHRGQREEVGAAEATRFVERWVGAQPLRIGLGQDPEDHYGRTLAHVFRADGRSLEAALLEAGLAVQIVVPPNLGLAACLHAAEARARAARRGLWREGPVPTARLRDGEKGFRLIEGRVTHVARTRASWWIELDDRVSLRVDRSDWKRFPRDLPEALRGQRVEARGWIIWRGSEAQRNSGHPPWSLRIRHPYAVSVRPAP